MTDLQLNLDSIVQAAPGLLASSVGDEVALLCLDRGHYFGLNASAALLWPSMQQPVSARLLLDRLLQHYDVPPEVANADLLELLSRLCHAGLVCICSQLSSPPPTTSPCDVS